MNIFLQVTGGIFLFIVAVAFVAALYFKFKWKKLKEQFSFSEKSTPSHIHLIPDEAPDWLKENATNRAISAFHSFEFTDVGAFRIKEMPMLNLFGLIQPQEQMMAVVYKHESVGVWADIAVMYENGEEFTVSNAPMGQELDTRPNVRKLFDKTWDELQLFKTAIEERGSGPYKSPSAEEFPRVFEESYARDMTWRNRRGGPTKEEIRRVAENMDIDFDEDQIDEAHAKTMESTMDQLNDECIQQFVETTPMPVSEWESIRDDIFTIHEKIPPHMLLEYLDSYIGFSEEQMDDMESLTDPDMPIFELFQRINEILPDELKLRKVGEVSEPVRGEIYAGLADKFDS